MKATRKVLLDEIVSHTIMECVTAKKALKQLNSEESTQIVKPCSLDEITVLEDYSGNEGPASHSVSIQTYSSNTAESLGGKKPVGCLEDFF
nr:histone-lysine N-methyltransferase ATXR7 isoform X1 [Tanacetum cinerariifolium]